MLLTLTVKWRLFNRSWVKEISEEKKGNMRGNFERASRHARRWCTTEFLQAKNIKQTFPVMNYSIMNMFFNLEIHLFFRIFVQRIWCISGIRQLSKDFCCLCYPHDHFISINFISIFRSNCLCFHRFSYRFVFISHDHDYHRECMTDGWIHDVCMVTMSQRRNESVCGKYIEKFRYSLDTTNIVPKVVGWKTFSSTFFKRVFGIALPKTKVIVLPKWYLFL